MSANHSDDVSDLIAKFSDREQPPEEVDQALLRVMKYIDENTGLLGDYNDGLVFLGDGGRILQWYGRTSHLSDHDDLLRWLQTSEDADEVFLPIVTFRNHPETGETKPYAEIHLKRNWGIEDE